MYVCMAVDVSVHGCIGAWVCGCMGVGVWASGWMGAWMYGYVGVWARHCSAGARLCIRDLNHTPIHPHNKTIMQHPYPYTHFSIHPHSCAHLHDNTRVTSTHDNHHTPIHTRYTHLLIHTQTKHTLRHPGGNVTYLQVRERQSFNKIHDVALWIEAWASQ